MIESSMTFSTFLPPVDEHYAALATAGVSRRGSSTADVGPAAMGRLHILEVQRLIRFMPKVLGSPPQLAGRLTRPSTSTILSPPSDGAWCISQQTTGFTPNTLGPGGRNFADPPVHGTAVEVLADRLDSREPVTAWLDVAIDNDLSEPPPSHLGQPWLPAKSSAFSSTSRFTTERKSPCTISPDKAAIAREVVGRLAARREGLGGWEAKEITSATR